MVGTKHLSLQSLRLNGAGDWKYSQQGLAFLFIKSGTGSYADARSTFHLGPGDILSLNGSAGGTLAAAKGGELVFLAFSLQFEHFFPLFAGEEISVLKQVMESLKVPKMISVRHPLSRRCQEMLNDLPAQHNLDYRTQLLRVAGVLLSEEFGRSKQQRPRSVRMEDHMVQVFESLSAEDLLSLSVGEMAKRFNCSRRHLNRLFNRYFGFSVASIRMEMRLLKAASLLRDPDIKVIDVAERCGFNHLGLFNGCFRRRFGTSPGQWRKLNSAGSAGTGGTNGAHPLKIFSPEYSTEPAGSKPQCGVQNGDGEADPLSVKAFGNSN